MMKPPPVLPGDAVLRAAFAGARPRRSPARAALLDAAASRFDGPAALGELWSLRDGFSGAVPGALAARQTTALGLTGLGGLSSGAQGTDRRATAGAAVCVARALAPYDTATSPAAATNAAAPADRRTK